jgi:hypothetical protein
MICQCNGDSSSEAGNRANSRNLYTEYISDKGIRNPTSKLIDHCQNLYKHDFHVYIHYISPVKTEIKFINFVVGRASEFGE